MFWNLKNLNSILFLLYICFFYITNYSIASQFTVSQHWLPQLCYSKSYTPSFCSQISDQYSFISTDFSYLDFSFNVYNKNITFPIQAKHDEIKIFLNFVDFINFPKILFRKKGSYITHLELSSEYENNALFVCDINQGQQYLKTIISFWSKDFSPINAQVSDHYNYCNKNQPILIRSNSTYLSTEDLKSLINELPSMNVGFDIDGTLLYPEGPIYHLLNNSQSDFYNLIDSINTFGLDSFSIPKSIPFELIKIHQERGDNIYFITARVKSKKELLSDYIKYLYSMTDINPVIFTSGSYNKFKYMQDLDLMIYYGDLDSDMLTAEALNIKYPIRILNSMKQANNQNCSEETENKRSICLGVIGERILLDSDKIIPPSEWIQLNKKIDRNPAQQKALCNLFCEK